MRDITPSHLRCTYSASCPAVYEDGDNLHIVGKFPEISKLVDLKIGLDETAVTIPRAYLAGLTPGGSEGGHEAGNGGG